MSRRISCLTTLLVFAAASSVSLGAVTISFSATAPMTGPSDQFNFLDDATIPGGTAPGSGAYNQQAYSDNAGPPGQTFTTPAGALPFKINSISVKSVGDGGGGVFTAPNTWGLRISSVSGTTLTPLNTVTGIPTVAGTPTTSIGWLTWGLSDVDALSLSPNTQYAFEAFSSAGWFGIDATQGDAAYANGTAFNSAGPARTFTDATTGNLANHGYDRTFHVALEAVPEPAACVLAIVAIGGLMGLQVVRRRRR